MLVQHTIILFRKRELVLVSISGVSSSTYEEQVLLATNMMAMLVNRLRELGRLDNSFVIIQSDHGWWEPARGASNDDPNRMFITMNEEVRREITELNFLEKERMTDASEVDTRFGVLLMVKPPARCLSQETADILRVDSSLTQLKDLREFVTSVVSGHNAQCVFPSREFVDMYVGLTEGGAIKAIEGEANAFRVDSDGRWEILPSISFVAPFPGAVKFRVREFQDGTWTGNFLNGATAKMVASDSTLYAKVISASYGEEMGWVDFSSVPAGEYTLVVYKAGMRGVWAQTTCEGAAATEGITVQNDLTEGNIAVVQENISIAQEIVWCKDVGLEAIPPP